MDCVALFKPFHAYLLRVYFAKQKTKSKIIIKIKNKCDFANTEQPSYKFYIFQILTNSRRWEFHHYPFFAKENVRFFYKLFK